VTKSRLLQRWTNSALTFFVLTLMFGMPSLALTHVFEPVAIPITAVNVMFPGSLFLLLAYGMFNSIYLGMFSDRDSRRIEKKEEQMWRRESHLAEMVLVGPVGFREQWIRAHLDGLESLENDEDLGPLLRWRFRFLFALGLLCLGFSLTLRFFG
jgi:hypothetical protein